MISELIISVLLNSMNENHIPRIGTIISNRYLRGRIDCRSRITSERIIIPEMIPPV